MEFIYKIAIDGDQEYLDNILEELRKDKGKKFDDIIWWYDKAYFNSVGFVAVPLKWKGDKFLVHFVNDGERFFFQRDVIHYGAKAILNKAEKDEIYKVMDEIQQYYHNPKLPKEEIKEKIEKIPIEEYVEIKDIFNIHEEYEDFDDEYANIENRRERVINNLVRIIKDLEEHNEDLEVKMEKRIKRIPIDEYPPIGEFFKNIKERNAPQVDYINNLLNEINPDNAYKVLDELENALRNVLPKRRPEEVLAEKLNEYKADPDFIPELKKEFKEAIRRIKNRKKQKALMN